MQDKITKWVLKEVRNDGKNLYLSKRCNIHDVVCLDDENILFLQTIEFAKDYNLSMGGNFIPKKVTIKEV